MTMELDMNVTFDFQGQNFLVTGASSGIGRETAKELLESGATVLGIARKNIRLHGFR